MTTAQARKHPRVLVVLDRTADAPATVSSLRAMQPGKQDLVLLLVLPHEATVHDIKDAQDRLAHEATGLDRLPCAVETDLRLGSRVTQIVGAPIDHDVIAMVRHPRSFLERLLMRGDADNVARQAPVPVLFLAEQEGSDARPARHRPARTWTQLSAGKERHGGTR